MSKRPARFRPEAAIPAALLLCLVLAPGVAVGADPAGVAAEEPAAAPPEAGAHLCPACKAPLEPGALFCSNCGRKIEAPVPPAGDKPKGQPAVVQVVAVCDSEITSAWGSMAYESNFRIDSIIGSGFAIGPGEIVTDSGMLNGAKEIVLKTSGGRSYPARVVGVDRMIGVALLAAEIPDVAPLTLRTGEPVRPGETLAALGFPAAGQAAGEVLRSNGVVSGLHRGGHGLHPIEDYFQTDTSLPRGIGGGPLVDARGRVVGMSMWRLDSGIAMGLPAEWIDRALTWIRAGSSQRAWMGAYTVPADSESRRRYGLPSEVTLVVEQVFPDSPAAAAGVRRGDGLLKIDGEAATTLPRLHERLLGAKPGDKVSLSTRRKEETLQPVVTLAARPEKPRLSGQDSLRFFGGVGIGARSDNTLVVEEVTPGSTTAGSKIGPGDVLLSVLSKKDWEHGAKDNTRWRSVRTMAEIEERVATGYSDLDFCLGLRFKTKKGEKEEVLVCKFLTQTGPL
jgi:S1-C subfamily serine protease